MRTNETIRGRVGRVMLRKVLLTRNDKFPYRFTRNFRFRTTKYKKMIQTKHTIANVFVCIYGVLKIVFSDWLPINLFQFYKVYFWVYLIGSLGKIWTRMHSHLQGWSIFFKYMFKKVTETPVYMGNWPWSSHDHPDLHNLWLFYETIYKINWLAKRLFPSSLGHVHTLDGLGLRNSSFTMHSRHSL